MCSVGSDKAVMDVPNVGPLTGRAAGDSTPFPSNSHPDTVVTRSAAHTWLKHQFEEMAPCRMFGDINSGKSARTEEDLPDMPCLPSITSLLESFWCNVQVSCGKASRHSHKSACGTWPASQQIG